MVSQLQGRWFLTIPALMVVILFQRNRRNPSHFEVEVRLNMSEAAAGLSHRSVVKSTLELPQFSAMIF